MRWTFLFPFWVGMDGASLSSNKSRLHPFIRRVNKYIFRQGIWSDSYVLIVYVAVSSFSLHSLLVELLSPCVVNTLV
jgi:hypothetical protein